MVQDLTVFQKTYDFLLWLKPVAQKFAKAHKYGLGIEIENETVRLLKKIIEANLSRSKKEELIEESLVVYEIIRTLVRLSKDYKQISVRQYEFASKNLVEIGNLLGGWRRKFSKNFQAAGNSGK
ncbi:diversity-generating retroelement protein Avd [Candidatus Parcubacteria bacterium]|nr:MAG: diversity-generating retroelement protein Avd [Candidatus Parcubacteria bacterium]